MRYIKLFEYFYGEGYNIGDLVKYIYSDDDDNDFDIFRIHDIDHKSNTCFQLETIDDDGKMKHVMGWYRENNFEHATEKDFEEWKIIKSAKKYNL